MLKSRDHRFFFLLFLLACCLTGFIYSNTLQAPWQLDDFDNITFNAAVHINDLTFDSIVAVIQHALSLGRINRPVSYVSFGLNWYFGGADPTGYHIVNTGIHIITAAFLYLATLALFATPRLAGIGVHKARFITLLSTVLWMVNPIHTQAITYIVQRMAALAAMFYIVGLWCYLRGRLAESGSASILWIAAALFAFVIGCGSKENAVTLPLAMVLVESIFFQDLTRVTRKRIWLWTGAVAGLVLVLWLGALIYLNGDIGSVLSYSNRYFTPGERLLTQFRILVFYLSQIFYPVPNRLSIEHDIVLSTSLLQPWTTLPSIFVVCGVILIALFRASRWPMFSFAVLFFFLNHLIESSVVGLELIFEHRNYLPSMFLFLPVAQGVNKVLDYYEGRSRLMHALVACSVFLLMLGFAAGTFVRNLAWQSGKVLWEDAAQKAPASSRPLHNLALTHYQALGEYDQALELYQRALSLKKTNTSQEALLLNNIANIYFIHNEFLQAAFYWRRAVASYPEYSETRCRLALALAYAGSLEEAIQQLDEVVVRHPGHTNALNFRGVVFLQLGRFDEGIDSLRHAVKSQPGYQPALINLGAALTLAGHHDRGRWFLQNALFRKPNEKASLLWLALNHLETGKQALADHCIELLLATNSPEILDALTQGGNRFRVNDDIIVPGFDSKVMAAVLQRLHPQL